MAERDTFSRQNYFRIKQEPSITKWCILHWKKQQFFVVLSATRHVFLQLSFVHTGFSGHYHDPLQKQFMNVNDTSDFVYSLQELSPNSKKEFFVTIP